MSAEPPIPQGLWDTIPPAAQAALLAPFGQLQRRVKRLERVLKQRYRVTAAAIGAAVIVSSIWALSDRELVAVAPTLMEFVPTAKRASESPALRRQAYFEDHAMRAREVRDLHGRKWPSAYYFLLSFDELESTPVDPAKFRKPSGTDVPHAALAHYAARFQDTVRLEPVIHDLKGRPIPVDRDLPPLAFTIKDIASEYPTFRVKPPTVSPPKGAAFYYHFEVDTTPYFNSPNLLRHPDIRARNVEQDAVAHAAEYWAFKLEQRGLGAGPEFKMPFRISTLAVRHEGADDGLILMSRYARALTDGLAPIDALREIFEFTKYRFGYGDNSESLTGTLVFLQSPSAKCGNMNRVAATLAELAGMRVRTVGSFHPLNRTIYPAGGHTFAEVLIEGSWSYFDPFLDIFLPGESAQELANGEGSADLLINYAHDTSDRHLELTELRLGDLVQYRQYHDHFERCPPTMMLKLLGREEQYGQSWPLLRNRSIECGEDLRNCFYDRQEIHVRARYVIAKEGLLKYYAGREALPRSDIDPTSSAWAYTSFQSRHK